MQKIPVTKSFIPPLAEYTKILQKAFDNGWITNRGELVVELEEKLKYRHNLSNLTLMTNGTIPLQIAVKLLGEKGEVITTPFSYVATTAAILWENATPVFVDIDPKFLTIDEGKIEAAITSNTKAILATHVFGNPCNIEAIEAIAVKHGLSVIYDAAHAFDVKYNNKSIFNYGTISTCSFHATKLFHTGEGGALICNDSNLEDQCYYSHNFGHNGTLDFHGLGINGKMSELQAAMGISMLPYIKSIKNERKKIVEHYNDNLTISMAFSLRPNTEWNFAYYPVLLKNEEQLEKIEIILNQMNIFPRRYFYPSLNNLPYLNSQSCPVSEDISSRILCLPLYSGLSKADQDTIIQLINDNL